MIDLAVILGTIAIFVVVFRWHSRRWRIIRQRERLISTFMKFGVTKEQIDKALHDR